MPAAAATSQLFDLGKLGDNAMEALSSIFQEIRSRVAHRFPQTFVQKQQRETQANMASGHLLLLDKAVSARINALTPFANFKKVTGVSRVVWLDLDGKEDYNYEALSADYKSFVIILNLISMDSLISLSQFLKQRMNIFGSQDIALSVVLVDSDRRHSSQLLLESQGVWGDIDRVYHWPEASRIVFDDDIVTLDLPHGGLKQLYKDGSIEPVEQMAKTLLDMVIESDYKIRITNIYLKGDLAVALWKSYQKLWDAHLAALAPVDRKNIEDVDDALFSDQYSFFNRNVDFVCLERGVDLVSALLTELTYTGITDELIGVNLGLVSFNESSSGKDANVESRDGENDEGVAEEADGSSGGNGNGNGHLVQVKFGDPSDEVYPNIKDLNFSMVGPVLNAQAKQLQAEFDKRNTLKDIDEMKQFVGELNHLKDIQSSVQKHTTVAQRLVEITSPPVPTSKYDSLFPDDLQAPVYDYYREFIQLQQDITADGYDSRKACLMILQLMEKYEPIIEDVLRLLFLLSIVKKGIREQEYDLAKNAVINMYGIKYVPLFLRLRELKFIYPREAQSFLLSSTAADSRDFGKYQLIRDFRSIAYHMNLMPVVENEDLKNPSEPDFALPGYVPIIARLVQAIYDRSFVQPQTLGHKTGNDVVRYIKYGWDNLDLSQFNGEVYQDLLVPESKRQLFSSMLPPKMSQLASSHHNRKDMIIVSVVGGLTYSEAATIRHVLKKNEVTRGKQLVILTSGLIRAPDVFLAL